MSQGQRYDKQLVDCGLHLVNIVYAQSSVEDKVLDLSKCLLCLWFKNPRPHLWTFVLEGAKWHYETYPKSNVHHSQWLYLQRNPV
jgi:hypothetical protein